MFLATMRIPDGLKVLQRRSDAVRMSGAVAAPDRPAPIGVRRENSVI
jgi:hypothetical protein